MKDVAYLPAVAADWVLAMQATHGIRGTRVAPHHTRAFPARHNAARLHITRKSTARQEAWEGRKGRRARPRWVDG